MKNINKILDDVLRCVVEQSQNQSSGEIAKQANLQSNEIDQILDHLESKELIKKNEKALNYSPTIKGKTFLDSPPFWIKNKPFAWSAKNTQINSIWTVVKTTGIILNGFALLLLSFWTFQSNNKSQKFGKEKENIMIELNVKKKDNSLLKDSINFLTKENELLKNKNNVNNVPK